MSAGRRAARVTPTAAPEATAPSSPRVITQVLKTSPAGTPGTVQLQRQYGDKLLFVRQRLDPVHRVRLTTVELVVSTRRAKPYLRDKVLYPVQVSKSDREMVRMLRATGAEWNAEGRFWWLSGAKIRQLRLADRVMISLAKRHRPRSPTEL